MTVENYLEEVAAFAGLAGIMAGFSHDSGSIADNQ
jgi:hypothetical protein